jgi:serine/threonine protein kinase
MGGQHSRAQNGRNNDCEQCFFFLPAPFRVQNSGRGVLSSNGGGGGTSSTNSNPLLGTPLPDTPVHQRRKREVVQQAMRDEAMSKPLFSSKYFGLEKEPLGASVSNENNAPIGARSQGQEEINTMIHDGPDCERLLHAKYQLMEVLGVGSTSAVHRCVNKATDQHFACKVIDCEQMEERFAGMMAQFQTEVEALKNLRHSGIIRLYDVYLTGSKIFIVMELMEGGELFDYVVQKGTLTEEEASKIVRKVTSAIAYMHSQNFIHRDLKPENLLLKRTPKGPYDDIDVKIIDFGLSKVRWHFADW